MFRAEASSFTGLASSEVTWPPCSADGGAEPDRRVAARAADLEHLAAGLAGAEREQERPARRRHLERALLDGQAPRPPRPSVSCSSRRGRHGRDRRASARSRSTSSRTQQSARWSFTTPHACMAAYTVVGPTNRKPALRRSLASATDSGVAACHSVVARGDRSRCWARGPRRARPTARRRARSASVARAFAIAASILPRWRTMPASSSSRSTSASPKRGDPLGVEARERLPGTPAACAGSSATRARTGTPRGRAARRSRARRGPGGPIPRRGSGCTPASVVGQQRTSAQPSTSTMTMPSSTRTGKVLTGR